MIFLNIQDKQKKKDNQYLLSPPFLEVNVCELFDDSYFSQSKKNFQDKKNLLLIIFILLTN